MTWKKYEKLYVFAKFRKFQDKDIHHSQLKIHSKIKL